MNRLVEWDYREQPDFDAINNAMHAVFDGTSHPALALVRDTGSDQYALVVSTRPLSTAEVQSYYDGLCGACRAGAFDDCTQGCKR